MHIQNSNNANQIADHLFRHEYGRILAVLTRIFGSGNLQIAEDITQDTLLTALEKWRYQIPENPQAWLYITAKNKAVDYLRREKHFQKIAPQIPSGFDPNGAAVSVMDSLFLEHEIADSQLRMMFVLCHPDLAPEGQIALILRTLSGFSVPEIAQAFLSTESTINKRLFRARDKLRQLNISLEVPEGPALVERMSMVLKAIYLMFNEGYHSSGSNELIRQDLCFEAMRLCKILTEHPHTNLSKTFAMMALLCFQASRLDARLDESGSIILLKDQDRSLWNQELITWGFHYLDKSVKEEPVSTYHLEASIAASYCMSTTYESIDWPFILGLYNRLLQENPSPVVRLNRAVVLGKVEGPTVAIKELCRLDSLKEYALYQAILAQLYSDQKDLPQAMKHYKKALQLNASPAERSFLQQQITALKAQMGVS
ncbi:MAG: DNA-directed RNA polymerase sigma-70 factor [Saprospiraceae bacterium]|nr:MAG: DNA-directed RNA polymerase sigma-70 factor [Saprospiraceae bacterium]